MTEVVIKLAISRDVLLTSNMRPHWATRARHVRVIRDMGWIMAKNQRVQLMPTATCEVVAQWADHRNRDAANIEPSAKAAIDGITSAGLLTDDSSQYLTHVGYSIATDTHHIPGVACFLTLTFTGGA